jgi:hypothetical protein
MPHDRGYLVAVGGVALIIVASCWSVTRSATEKAQGWWAKQRSRGGIDVLPGRQRPTYLVFLFQMGRVSGLRVSSVALDAWASLWSVSGLSVLEAPSD